MIDRKTADIASELYVRRDRLLKLGRQFESADAIAFEADVSVGDGVMRQRREIVLLVDHSQSAARKLIEDEIESKIQAIDESLEELGFEPEPMIAEATE